MLNSKKTILKNHAFTKSIHFIVSIVLILTILIDPKPLPAQSKSVSSVNLDETQTTFAVISDFGTCSDGQEWVAQMINYWAPEFVVTSGDNWQGSVMTGGDCNSYESIVGDYYGETAPAYGLTDFVTSENFWPSPGNHDFEAPISQYLDYFDYIPTNSNGSKLYYDFVRGPVHFFMLDSIFTSIPEQQTWLEQKLTESTAIWNIVIFHSAPYSGGVHGFDEEMQWSFADMGADFVISGDNHIYERIEVGGIRYFNVLTGGGTLRTGDQIGEAYWGNSYGALKVQASETNITFEAYSTDAYGETLRDSYTESLPEPDAPIISTSHGSLTGFFSTQYTPSVSQSYQVSGENLEGDIQINSSAHYEISLDDLSFSSTIILPQSGGVVPDTTIYVRLNQTSTGTTNGFVTHTSSGANNVSVAVSGTTVEFANEWVAYNDCAWDTGQTETNITKYSVPGQGFLSSGLLIDHVSGSDTGVTATFTDSGNTYVELDPLYFGAESNAGTDAYNTFHGIVDMPGLISYGAAEDWWVDITFTGLDPDETYTFATTANRGGGLGGEPTAYPDRITVFTLYGDNGATNTSTAGVYAINDYTVAFPTGENTDTGYVARWTNIQPSVEGSFSIKAEGYDTYQAYAFSVFMLGQEVDFYTLSVSDDDNGAIELNPEGGVYSEGTTVTLTPVPEPGYSFSHWSGPDAGDIIPDGADYSIVMDADKSITANFISADCTLLSLPAISDTYMRNGETRSEFNYGGDVRVRVNPFYESGSLEAQLTGALFKWETPVIPEGATITNANLEFIVMSTASDHAFGLYNMRRDWIEGTNDGAPGTGASWTYYDDGSTAWGAGGAADTVTDRYDVNLWDATATDFTHEGIFSISLNGAGFDVIQGWADETLDNYGLTIQNYGGSSLDIWEIASKEETGVGYFPATLNITYCEPTNLYTLQVSADPTIGGTTDPIVGEHTYAEGSQVTINAFANPGYQFDYWSGDCTGSETCQVLIDGDKSVIAHFIELHDLTIEVAPENSGTTTPAVGTYTYTHGSPVTITADPEPGYEFSNWSGDCSGETCSVTMDADKTVTANFSLILYALDITKIGSGSGTVTSDPAGIDCGETCSYEFNPDTIITLTAVPDADSRFAGWTGGCTGEEETCQVTMDTAKTVSAEFIMQYDLTVTKTGSGSGAVTSVPAGIDCGENCTFKFDLDEVVALTAETDPDSLFSGWSDDCSGETCSVTMDGDKTVTANFSLILYALDITKIGSGSGTVTSDPAGIDCGETCSYEFNPDTIITLTAVPDADSRFAGWTGGCSGEEETCQVTMDTVKTVSAEFIMQYDLTVTKTGSGSGTVTSVPAGIDCGENCSAKFDLDEVVALTAEADPGSRFAGWSGACTGTDALCQITIDELKNVTANFIQIYELTVTTTGSGSGTVTSDPTGINCGATCSHEYDLDTIVTLTAVADEGSRFTGWSGEGCSGTDTCQVTMDAAKNVTADFIKRYSLTIRIYGSGTVVDTDAGIDCSESECTYEFDDEDVITLTAIPDTGFEFIDWSGGGCSGPGECIVTMDEDLLITAFFLEEEPDCYQLFIDHTGQGSDPIATPPNSEGCSEGYFEENVEVHLQAVPDEGWSLVAWSGTDDDTSKEIENYIVIQADHLNLVSVDYRIRVFVPLIMVGN
jgi:hypothetical protein